MRMFFDIVITLALICLALGATCWFAPQANTDNVALAHFVSLPFFGIGGLLLFIALIARML